MVEKNFVVKKGLTVGSTKQMLFDADLGKLTIGSDLTTRIDETVRDEALIHLITDNDDSDGDGVTSYDMIIERRMGDADSPNLGPVLALFSTNTAGSGSGGSSMLDDTNIGNILFRAETHNATDANFGQIRVNIQDSANTSRDSKMFFKVQNGSSMTEMLTINGENDSIDIGASSLIIPQDIVHTGDTNNKFTFGTDTQTFTTGGTSRMNISDSGVQIGSGTRVTTILDQNDMSSDSDTALATQQSIKAYVDDSVGAAGGGDITAVTAGSGLTGGATSGGATLTVGAGNGITVNTNDVAVTAAQTTITSVLNTSLVVGRDADNQIKFSTDNQMIFRVGAGDGVTFKASGEIEATKFDGALEGNADTATKIASITNSNIVQLTETQTLTNKTLTSPSIGTGFTFDSITFTSAQTSAESFANNDTSFMTSAAIEDKILSYSYTTNTGDITGVTAGTGLSGGGSSGSVTLNVSGLTVSELAANSIQLSTESFANNDTSIMTSAAIEDKILSYSYTTNTGDITGVTAGTGLSGGGSSGGVTLNVSGLTVSEIAAGSIQLSSESFSNDDTSIMTSAAIEDKILSYGYTTNTGDITGVDLTGGTGVTIGSETNTGSGAYSSTISIGQAVGTSDDVTFSTVTIASELIHSGDTNNKIGFGTDTQAFTVNGNAIMGISDGQVTVDGSVTVKERASAPADNAGYGQLWVKNTGTGQLFFTTDDGTDIQITTSSAVNASGGGGISNLVEDTSPQLGGDLDTNGHDIIIDDGKGVYADAISNGRELMLFGHTSSANSYIKIWNGISDTTAGTLFGADVTHNSYNTAGAGRMTGPGFEAISDEDDVGMSFKAKGLGQFVFTNIDSSADAAPVISLLRNTADSEVADDDNIGMIKFMGADSSMLEVGSETAIHDFRDYARIGVLVPDQTSGNADGEMYFSILVKDSQRRLLAVGSNNLAHGDTPAAGVAAKAGQVRTFSGNQALDYDDYAGLYLIATSALTFTLPADPNRGEQYVIISDTTGTVTIARNGNTINGASSNATITTRYEAKTFIATSSSAYIMLG